MPKDSAKILKFSITIFSNPKNNLEHLSHNVKKQLFSKLYLAFHFWTFYKCPFFISLLTFQKIFTTFKIEIKLIKLIKLIKYI